MNFLKFKVPFFQYLIACLGYHAKTYRATACRFLLVVMWKQFFSSKQPYTYYEIIIFFHLLF